MKLTATWHDVDRTNTHHEFESLAEVKTWLDSVLSEVGGDEGEFEGWAEEQGYSADAFGKLVYYDLNDRETVGDLTFYLGGSEVTPDELYSLAVEEGLSK